MSAATRRGLLGCTGLAAVALALPADAGMLDDAPLVDGLADPHLSWWRDWLAARNAADAAEATTAGDIDQLHEAEWAIESKILETVPTTLVGAAVVGAMLDVVIREGTEPEWYTEEQRGMLSLGAFLRMAVPAVTTEAVL